MRRLSYILVPIAGVSLTVALVPEASAAEPRTLIVSRHSAGPYAEGGASDEASISDDGRFVAFESLATNLVSGDTNGEIDVFVHDLTTGRTTIVSRHSSGPYGNAGSRNPSISGDGRFVAFESDADNLVSGDTNSVRDVFVHDRLADTTGRTTIASRHSSGPYGDGFSSRPSISDDGRYVAFDSLADNLVSGDTNAKADVFVHDRLASTTGRTSLVSRHSSGPYGNGDSRSPSIGGDGRHVAFHSHATNLVSGDASGAADVFVHDRLADTTGRTTIVSRHSNGPYSNGDSFKPAISGDGRFVAFHSDATNLASGDTNGTHDVFIHDRLDDVDGRTTLVSRHSLGNYGNNTSVNASISGDGRFVAFASNATNLVSGDDNGVRDTFVHRRY